MGYRSEVAIVLSQKGFDYFINKIKNRANPETLNFKRAVTSDKDHYESVKLIKSVLELLSYAEYRVKDSLHSFYFSSVKWYPQFDSVRSIVNLLNEIPKNPDTKEAEYGLLTVGEEVGDTEQSGNYELIYDAGFNVVWKMDISAAEPSDNPVHFFAEAMN